MLTFSNSFLWANCAASVHPHPAPVPIEAERSEAAQEGEAAAWLANLVLRGTAASPAEAEGEHAPNGWPIDYEMIRHVSSYVELVTRHGPVEAEQDVELWGGVVRGRPDAHTVGSSDVLRMYELKYGYRIVEPHGNTQLLLGAMALVQPHHRLVSLEIFQPRPVHANGPHRKWVLNRDELAGWENDLHQRMKAVFEDRPVATVGDQCDYCPRRAACHALASAVYADSEKIRSEHRARQLTAAEIGAELVFLEDAQKRLSARHEGIRAEMRARIKAGEHIPQWLLEPKHGNRTWRADAAIISALTGCEAHKRVLKSPSELEKEGANPEVVAALCERPFRGHELARWDEKKIERMFK